MSQTSETPKVYGTRICPMCKGICHENSWRSTYKIRNTYFCSELHLKRYVDERLRKQLKGKLDNWFEVEYTEQEFEDLKSRHYEKVNVVTA